MMAEFPVWEGYEERIDTFSFREKGSIKVPKSAREKAFSFQLDIEILSTRGNDYFNNKSLPAHSFYGYVVLVLRDHSKIQIPIEQPRQTLYYERREAAFSNWYALYLKAIDSFEKLFVSESQLKPIAESLGLTTVEGEENCPIFSGFEEIRLREAYVKCRFGTRFKLEASRWEPRPAVYGESCSYDGNSRQNDGDKDEGLPTDGVQPATSNDPTDPYANFPSPSEESELGDWSNTSKLDTIDDQNPNNAPLDPTEYLWRFSFTWTVLNQFGQPQDIPCGNDPIFARGTAQDSITVRYLDVVGFSTTGEPFQRIRLEWKGSELLTINAGFRNGSVQECGRVIVPE